MSPVVFYGASQREWEAFETLCFEDIRPTICDPQIERHPLSKSEGELLKNPSFVREDGYGSGIFRWPDTPTKTTMIWRQHPAHGICIVARQLHAIDIDIADEQMAHYVEGLVYAFMGVQLPLRSRPNSGKRLLVYRLTGKPEGHQMVKTVVRTPHGNIEFLHERQQFVAAGTHTSGVRYEWPYGIPASLDEVPELTFDELIALHNWLARGFGTGTKWVFSRNKIEHFDRDITQVETDDPVIKYLADNDWIKGYRDDGSLNVRSPWAGEYSTPDKDDSAVYYPAGLGGRSDPGFKGLHASDADKTATDFLIAIGYRQLEVAGEFPVAEPGEYDEDEDRPELTFTKSGKLEPTLQNLIGLLGWKSKIGHEIYYDTFKDALLIREYRTTNWRPVTDNTFTELRLRLEAMGMKSIAKEAVRDAVYLISDRNSLDSAQGWLNGLYWDGVPRIDSFHRNALRLPDSDYHQAVGRYMWTALAGRVLQPGSKADMVPILIGSQGLRKSTLVASLAPSPDEFTTINMSHNDADLSRQLRGKLVAEWDELRGLNSRDAEMLKGWVSRTHDEWTPKFKEFAHKQARRFLVLGSANTRRVLNDPTGLRRWLPVYVQDTLGINYVLDYRDQLWAEARERFKAEGILWRDAERLAAPAHRQATAIDVWTHDVRRWLQSHPGKDGWDTGFILHNAIGMPTAQANRGAQERVRQVMTYLGWAEDEDGYWRFTLA